MSSLVWPPRSRRFEITLALSIGLHALLLFVVTVTFADSAPIVPTLDVIFSQTQTALTPKQADFLAQANQQGGGNRPTPSRPRDDQIGVVPQEAAQTALQHMQAAHPQPQPNPTQDRVLTTTDGEQIVAPAQPHERYRLPATALNREQRDAEIARLAAELHLQSQDYAKRPTRKFVSASTREYAYANYLRAWVVRAERVGNLNYPDEARRRHLSGRVVVTVGVRRDGRLESAHILISSGSTTLDDAALRIVTLAQPFPPLPQTKEAIDILQVTRTWIFSPGGHLHDEHSL